MSNNFKIIVILFILCYTVFIGGNMNRNIVKFATEGKVKSVQEIAEKFEIPDSQIATLRKRLKENKIKTADGRGRKKIDF